MSAQESSDPPTHVDFCRQRKLTTGCMILAIGVYLLENALNLGGVPFLPVRITLVAIGAALTFGVILSISRRFRATDPLSWWVSITAVTFFAIALLMQLGPVGAAAHDVFGFPGDRTVYTIQDSLAGVGLMMLVLASVLVTITAAERTVQVNAAERAAAESNKIKAQFLANMSHEIRTPMTAILGFADVLHESGDITKAPPERIEAIETIRRNSEHLLALINDILDVSKIESGKMDIERIPCSPFDILHDIQMLMRHRAAEKQLDWSVACTGPIPLSIQSDPTRLRQILINLAGNAVKFTEQGAVQVIARFEPAGDDQPQLRFDVIDDGIGMSDAQIQRLFQPFSQADSSTTRKYGGTGLGLMISKNLAERLGGDITVTSREGAGSIFTVTVATGPLDDTPMVTYEQWQRDERRKSLEQRSAALPKLQCRVLLVEDGIDNQRLIKMFLEKAGAKVTIANNGLEALQTLGYEGASPALAADFDVVLMDMQMPVLDGYDTTRQLRARGFEKPVIALTAHAMRDIRETCLAAGCDDFATKPIDRTKLLTLIAEHAQQSPQPTA